MERICFAKMQTATVARTDSESSTELELDLLELVLKIGSSIFPLCVAWTGGNGSVVN